MSERTNPGLILGGEPRVDLLPPEVHARARGARARRGLVVLVVVALVVAVGATVAATVNASAAASSLAAAQQQTNGILAERQKYAEAETVTSQVATVTATIKSAGASDVLWSDLYEQVSKMLPTGSAVVGGTFVSPTAWEPVPAILGPLRVSHAVTLTLVVRSKTPIDAGSLLSKLSSLTGFADATLDADAFNGNADDYFTQFTVDLNTKALSGRFADGSPSQ